MQRLVASWFGTGLILRKVRGSDDGAGTLSSLFTFGLAILIGELWGWPAQLAAAGLVVVASLFFISEVVDEHGDAGWIVIDEAGGMLLALVGLAFWPGAVVAFVVFRIADIYKRLFPGVAAAERLRGSLGVTADDLVAGLYGLVVGHIIQLLLT